MKIILGFLAGMNFTFVLHHITKGSFYAAIPPLVTTFIILAIAYSKD